MIVQKVEFTDVFAANCYFYIDEASKHGFVIDPSAKAEMLLDIIEKNGWKIEKILLTHSHLDHIGATLELSEALKIDIFGGSGAVEYLSNPALKGHFTDWNIFQNMHFLKDRQEIVLSGNPKCRLTVLSTPGHTLDSVVYYDQNQGIAFCGDTIFKSGIGRTDIEGSGGNYRVLMESITQRVLTLPQSTILYPGHGDETTVEAESIA